jgi:hypothetical protein
MILSLMISQEPPRISDDNIARLADQFGTTKATVRGMVTSLLTAIRDAGKTLDNCQPAGATRCPRCAHILQPEDTGRDR